MTAQQVVNLFYELNNDVAAKKRHVSAFKTVLADDVIFKGPTMTIQGAENYVNLLGQFLTFHDALEIVAQFVDGNQVCTITNLTLNTPSGTAITLEIAEWCVVENGKINRHTIFYDPRAFMAAFPM